MIEVEVNKLEPWWYTPFSERESDKPTRFYLKPLTEPKQRAIIAEMRSNESGTYMTDTGYEIALRNGIKDWENFCIGGELPKFRMSLVDKIPAKYQIELAWEIFNTSALSEEEKKTL